MEYLERDQPRKHRTIKTNRRWGQQNDRTNTRTRQDLLRISASRLYWTATFLSSCTIAVHLLGLRVDPKLCSVSGIVFVFLSALVSIGLFVAIVRLWSDNTVNSQARLYSITTNEHWKYWKNSLNEIIDGIRNPMGHIARQRIVNVSDARFFYYKVEFRDFYTIRKKSESLVFTTKQTINPLRVSSTTEPQTTTSLHISHHWTTNYGVLTFAVAYPQPNDSLTNGQSNYYQRRGIR
ncbi:hypothetical protein LOAG_10466 [Loa loa]|uniref:Uncharacterized protein n=1 Tax=Loa loa TaxID=7209 RepID=A0A1S0TQE0_LOALO|nr:hypothetical protein LOAG_10466 [Loa loa]EFO18032.1 hypothetical protein LOAG_10466 [Loa loa]